MRAVSASIAAALLVWSASVRAESTPAAPPMREFPRLRAPSLTHEMQFGIAVMPGTGFRGIFPYQDMTFCGQTADGQLKRVCTGRLPFFVDAQLSYGVGRRW